MREYVGYGDTINANDRATIRSHVRGNQLNGDTYPEIGLVLTVRCKTKTIACHGDMTIRNTTREMDIIIDFVNKATHFTCQAWLISLRQTSKYYPYSAFFGVVRNSEPLKMAFDLWLDKPTDFKDLGQSREPPKSDEQVYWFPGLGVE